MLKSQNYISKPQYGPPRTHLGNNLNNVYCLPVGFINNSNNSSQQYGSRFHKVWGDLGVGSLILIPASTCAH